MVAPGPNVCGVKKYTPLEKPAICDVTKGAHQHLSILVLLCPFEAALIFGPFQTQFQEEAVNRGLNILLLEFNFGKKGLEETFKDSLH